MDAGAEGRQPDAELRMETPGRNIPAELGPCPINNVSV
jgi:hypothetical protein